jgi:ATP-dependent Clp protease ATP-binding subunit ClpA
MPAFVQVLGRNLEALVTRAQEVKADWRDEFVSVEHMLLAFVDDTKFGTQLLKDANLDKTKIEAAVKEIRGSNRVTDQVAFPFLCWESFPKLHNACCIFVVQLLTFSDSH